MAKDNKSTKTHKIFTAIGLVLCIVFGFMLVCNITIIVKGTLHPEKPPSVLGTTPMVVLSGSMSGTAEDHIEVGDLIFVSPIEAKELKEGNVIAFMEENSTTVVTHRIMEVVENGDGTVSFITKGDANNTEDQNPVPEDRLVGIYKTRIPKVGDLAIFMQTPLGMILFIGVPLLAFIIYDIIRRQQYANMEKRNTSELQAEIERLRALAGEKADSEESAN